MAVWRRAVGLRVAERSLLRAVDDTRGHALELECGVRLDCPWVARTLACGKSDKYA